MAALLAFILLVLFLILQQTIVNGDVDYEGATTFTLDHTFQSGDDAVWSKRGLINVRSLKPGRTYISQPTGPSAEETAKLIEAVQNGGIYRVRVPIKIGQAANPDSVHYVTSFTLACAFYESRLSDEITINFDQSGEAIGVSIATHPGVCSGRTVNDTELARYNTTVDIVQSVPGPVPDTQSYIEKMKKEEMDRAKGQQQDNRSFFAKYWMYIVPGVVIMLLMNSMDPQAGQGGGGAAR